MTQEDFDKFLNKVSQLQALVKSVEENKTRREQLKSCSTHYEVVELAKSWGFDIGKRWGE